MAKRKRTAAASAATSSPAAPDTQDEPVASSAPIIAECPYTVEFRSGARKTAARKRTRKAPKEDQELDQTLPEDSNTVFCVRPDKQWDKLKKYRNFVGEFTNRHVPAEGGEGGGKADTAL